jgi:3-oxoacyl-[acyl-carrier protein] reductase
MAEVGGPCEPRRILIFGGGGAIGKAIAEGAIARGWDVVVTARRPQVLEEQSVSPSPKAHCVVFDPLSDESGISALDARSPYSAICWAQGANTNDNVYTVDLNQHWELYKANCLYILSSLKLLLSRNLLTKPARLCVVSSIWQKISRQNKLSYSMTKAALQGLVLSASTDLAADGHLVNAVLPGALDTPMTRSNLTGDQLDRLRSATKFDKLPALNDVASLVLYLCSPENTGITGQFIAADLGFSNVHLL